MSRVLFGLRTVSMHAAEPLLGGLVLNVLYPMGLAGRLPIWVVDGLLLVCAVYQQPQVQNWLTGGDLHRRLWPRLGFHLALYTAVLLVVGWGPLSGLAFIGTLCIHLRWTGSAAWRVAAVLGVLAVLTGQVIIELGWCYSFLPRAQGHAIAAIVTVTALLISRLLGLAVAQREQAECRLRHDATHDGLTGLVNRATFWRLLEESLHRLGQSPRMVAVLYVDLDGFKQINDTMGHEAGDTVLAGVGAVLRRCVLGSDVVARLGGDEFAVLLSGVDSDDNAIVFAQRVVTELGEPFLVNGKLVYVRASVGVAVSGPAQPIAAGVLMRRADVAMYRAKRQKTRGWELYVDGMAEDQASAAALANELRRAIRGDELRLQYQPIVALDTGELVGVEALVRWQHPTRGWLPPNCFVALAEEQGIIGDLGAWVLERACEQTLRWQRKLPSGRRLSVNVNVSPRELERGSLVDTVLAVLDRTGFDACDLVLEVTENALVDESAVPQLTAVAAQGVRIALDDFGTGYSSLRSLTRLPVDILKLDRCFVAELNGTKEAAAVAEAVVRLSQVLRLAAVAEGVESAEQAKELSLLGFRTGQGNHFARPLHPEAVDALIDGASGRRLGDPPPRHGDDAEPAPTNAAPRSAIG